MLIMVMRIIILIVVITFLVRLFKINSAVKMERRIGRYSTYSIQEEHNSLSERIGKIYNHLVMLFEKKYGDNKKNVSNRYGKYIVIGDDVSYVRFIINKLLISILFLILVILSFTIQGKVINIFGFIFSFVIGYYIYDIYLVINNKIKIKKIRNDLLRAVIIMNNAFKAGKSIMQAVEIASKELPDPIKNEFEKIYQDMLFGLSADVVFERFGKRIDIEEVRYISSSLTILNKSGGNIVNIFSSIEKTLFDKKRLEEELKNATAASNLVVKVLIAIPFVFVFIIYVLSPNYFSPLFSSVLGYFLLGIMVIMFIVYVIILRRVMKVRV